MGSNVFICNIDMVLILILRNLFSSYRGIAVILFWADWAPQCQQMSDVLVELAKDNQLKHIKFAKVHYCFLY